jgi:SAM-dependent methyltransferase
MAVTKPESDRSFTSEVARFYESTLVPMIFEPYAEDLALRAQELQPEAVLEVACGTGVVTRALARLLPQDCVISATDLNTAMVTHAEQIGTNRPVSWQTADVMALPFEDDTFDVVLCQFSTMFFPDRIAAYREIRRVLRPGGRFLFNVWRRIEENEFADVVTQALRERYPEDPPAFLARTPHGHGSSIEIRTEVVAAGFVRCELSPRDDVSHASGPDIPAIAYCQGTPLRNEVETREPGGLQEATEQAAAALRDRFGEGPIEARISAVVVEAS